MKYVGRHAGAMLVVLFALGLAAGNGVAGPATGSPERANPDEQDARHRLVRDGVAIEFEARPVEGEQLREGALADIRFSLSDVNTGQPLSGQTPGAWLDLSAGTGGADGREAMSCRTKIGLFLKGTPGMRPMLDLNSYYLLTLNKDASITVIDPQTSVAGITSTLARIALERPPMDWVAGRGDKRLYVSMPDAGKIAVIDADSFTVKTSVAAGSEPVRLALQPDGRYLWVGNNARDAKVSGVTVIDTQSLEPVLSAATGTGHHEIAFDAESRHAFVSSRDSGTLTVFDIARLKKLREIPTGPMPLAVAFSPLSSAVYVADGKAGTVSVIDARSLKVRKTLPVGKGIGPLRFAPGGRYAFVLNTLENSAVVIDAASDEIVNTLEVAAEPWQIVFTRAFAYIRGLASPRVTMVDLASLGKDRQPGVLGFDAGPAAPKLAGDLPLAPGIAAARDDAAVFVVNPVDNTTYFYMEGMNAPMFGYLNRGHTARAATVVDRSLRELSPGVFGARVKLPAAGRFDVAFFLNQPQITHCFVAEVQVDPERQRLLATPRIEFLLDSPAVSAGSTVTARLRVLQGSASQPRTGVQDLRVRYFRAPASRPYEVPAREVGEGIYEAAVELPEDGAWYLHAGSQSLGIGFGDQPYVSLRAIAAQAPGEQR